MSVLSPLLPLAAGTAATGAELARWGFSPAGIVGGSMAFFLGACCNVEIAESPTLVAAGKSILWAALVQVTTNLFFQVIAAQLTFIESLALATLAGRILICFMGGEHRSSPLARAMVPTAIAAGEIAFFIACKILTRGAGVVTMTSGLYGFAAALVVGVFARTLCCSAAASHPAVYQEPPPPPASPPAVYHALPPPVLDRRPPPPPRPEPPRQQFLYEDNDFKHYRVEERMPDLKKGDFIQIEDNRQAYRVYEVGSLKLGITLALARDDRYFLKNYANEAETDVLFTVAHFLNTKEPLQPIEGDSSALTSIRIKKISREEADDYLEQLRAAERNLHRAGIEEKKAQEVARRPPPIFSHGWQIHSPEEVNACPHWGHKGWKQEYFFEEGQSNWIFNLKLLFQWERHEDVQQRRQLIFRKQKDLIYDTILIEEGKVIVYYFPEPEDLYGMQNKYYIFNTSSQEAQLVDKNLQIYARVAPDTGESLEIPSLSSFSLRLVPPREPPDEPEEGDLSIDESDDEVAEEGSVRPGEPDESTAPHGEPGEGT